MPTLQDIQERTFKAMCDCLDKNKLCCVERPTGFGKTKLFMDYVAQYPEEMFLYVYDVTSAMVDIINKYDPRNVVFISYAAISKEKDAAEIKQFICEHPWHTIIFDEAHLMGGKNIQKLLQDIIPLAVSAGVRILGGTATKLRTDLVDVSQRFFNGFGVFEYTMLDAVNDGIMLEPVWAVTAHYKTLIEDLKKRVDQSNSFVRTTISQLTKAYADIDGVSTVYRDTVVKTFGEVPDILRFIVFYPDVKSLNDNRNRDVQEFTKAFPTHDVVHVALSSDSEHLDTITEVETTFTMEGKQVQLIFAVNMLNQSYHSDLLTGVVMYRASYSNIIFTQQLGRIMSVTAKQPGIVFDNVGNVFIRPDRAMAQLQLMLGDEYKVGSSTPHTKGHLHLTLRATKEFVEFQEVYKRIIAAQQITDEHIEAAKRNWNRHKNYMPWDAFYSITGVPRWLVEDEHDRV